MPVRRDKKGQWRFRKVVHLPDGRKHRISGTPDVNTKIAAEAAERAAIAQAQAGARSGRKEPITFKQWFNGRFWTEYVEVENSEGERDNKRGIFTTHLEEDWAEVPITAIDAGMISAFRAKLAKLPSKKTANNVLSVFSRALWFAEELKVIAEAPRVKLFPFESPEIEWWDFDQYARVIATARADDAFWFAGICLAGEQGARVGEVAGLRWREDVDLIARTMTINQQIRASRVGPPKGRKRRTIPMTSLMLEALKALDVVREGYVVRDLDGSHKTHRQARSALNRIYRCAGLPQDKRPWHKLRHSFGTHAALLGVNPWKLQSWMGHKAITTTMAYIHVAEAHARPIPPHVVAAGAGIADPDARIIAMLGARAGNVVANVETTARNVAE